MKLEEITYGVVQRSGPDQRNGRATDRQHVGEHSPRTNGRQTRKRLHTGNSVVCSGVTRVRFPPDPLVFTFTRRMLCNSQWTN